MLVAPDMAVHIVPRREHRGLKQIFSANNRLLCFMLLCLFSFRDLKTAITLSRMMAVFIMNIRDDQIQKIIQIHKEKYGVILNESEAKEYLEKMVRIFDWLIKNKSK
jgi:hypothetical protein